MDHLQEMKFGLPEPVFLAKMVNPTICEKLKSLHVPDEIIDKVIKEALMYDSRLTGDIIFRSESRLYGEMLNPDFTTTVLPNSSLRAFWCIKNVAKNEHTERAIICTSAVEALSLCSLHHHLAQRCKESNNISNIDAYVLPTIYISVGNEFVKERIEIIRRSYGMRPLFIATLNTDDGNSILEKCKGFLYTHEMRPEHETWKEELELYIKEKEN